jgi:hypothetical protein
MGRGGKIIESLAEAIGYAKARDAAVAGGYREGAEATTVSDLRLAAALQASGMLRLPKGSTAAMRAAIAAADAVREQEDGRAMEVIRAAAARIEELLTWGMPEGPRMCVNCGKVVPADVPRTANACGFPEDPEMPGFYPCTIDPTYGELVAQVQAYQHQEALKRAVARELARGDGDEAAE